MMLHLVPQAVPDASVVSRVDTLRIPGDHDEIVTRHIERIAKTLEELLA
jgi:hypothetical protein